MPREDGPVINVESPSEDLHVDPTQLRDWVEAGELPAFRVPPPTHDNDPPAGPLWALLADINALARGNALSPPAEQDDHLRRVYVIELVGCEIGSHQEGPCVYVGESRRSPRNRFIQHLLDYKAGKNHVHKWGTRLLPDLYHEVPKSLSDEESRRRETQTARRLAAVGYHIHGVNLDT